MPDTHNITGEVMTKDGTMNRDALPAIFNPEDLNALEMALEIKERHGGTVTVITMGPPKAANILRESLFRGADKVDPADGPQVRRRGHAGDLRTPCSAPSRSWTSFDLVLCGRQAIDGDTAQVGPQTAEKLGIPQITYAETIIDIADGKITAQRALDHGSEIVRCTLPCLLTVVGSANTPRPASVRRRMALKLAATPIEYAALRERWPEFETDRCPRGLPDRARPEDARLDGRGHRRRRRTASAWPVRPHRSTRSTSWSWSGTESKDDLRPRAEGIAAMVAELVHEYIVG